MNDSLLNGIDIIYWINLDRSLDRKKRMLQMFTDDSFKNIPIKRFSAVDGKNENIDEMMTMRKRKLTNPEYGCLLSHLEIINEFSNTDCPVSTGRGASAAADWAAHKNIGLPDLRGNTWIGLDTLGGASDAGRLTATTAGANTAGTTNGEQIGSEGNLLSKT